VAVPGWSDVEKGHFFPFLFFFSPFHPADEEEVHPPPPFRSSWEREEMPRQARSTVVTNAPPPLLLPSEEELPMACRIKMYTDISIFSRSLPFFFLPPLFLSRQSCGRDVPGGKEEATLSFFCPTATESTGAKKVVFPLGQRPHCSDGRSRFSFFPPPPPSPPAKSRSGFYDDHQVQQFFFFFIFPPLFQALC